LKATDLPAGNTFPLIDGGDQVAGQVTLDTCGFTFTTEPHRVARRQYAALDANGNYSGLSNELVAYDTPDNATKALGEWRTAVATCPHTQVTGSDPDDEPTVYTILSSANNVAALPVASNTVTSESQVSADGTFYEITMLQQKGRYLDIVYADSDAAPTATDLQTAESIAAITGRRLATQN
jgi:hypothetical protein